MTDTCANCRFWYTDERVESQAVQRAWKKADLAAFRRTHKPKEPRDEAE